MKLASIARVSVGTDRNGRITQHRDGLVKLSDGRILDLSSPR